MRQLVRCVLVRVIQVGPNVVGDETVGIGRPWLDGILSQASYTIFGVGNGNAVPVNSRTDRQLIDQRHDDHITLLGAQFRAGAGAVVRINVLWLDSARS